MADLLTLIVLAMVDSLSFGTLVIPLVLLLRWQGMKGSLYATYLATVSSLYFLVGTALLLGMRQVVEAAGEAAGAAWFEWMTLALGLCLLAFGVLSPSPEKKTAEQVMAEQAARLDGRRGTPLSSPFGVAALAAGAVVVEAATMLPYLAAIGIIQSMGAPFVAQLGILALYCLAMTAPAVLAGAFVTVRGSRVFERIRGLVPRLEYEVKATLPWIAAIVGIRLIAHSAMQLGIF